MNAILEVFLNTFWQAAAVALVVWVGLRAMPRVNAATRGAIWWSVLALVLLLPVIRIVRVRPRPAPVRSVVYVKPVAPVPQSRSMPSAPAPPVRVRAGSWPAFFLALWGAVCLAQFVRLAISFRHLRRLKRDALPAAPEQRANLAGWLPAYGVRRPVRLLVSRDIPVPVAVGFLRPAVLLPESLLSELTPQELDHVLLHELAHLARRDDWANLFARIAWALLALHPVAAFALRQIDRERELACDDWVVSATGAARPYAASLARLFELCSSQRGILLASGISDGGSQLGDRIALLLRRGREFTPRASALRVSLCTGGLLMFVLAASCAPAWMAFAQAPVRVARRSAGPPPAPAPQRNSLLATLVANGYGDLSVDEIVSLKNNGVTPEFIAGVAQSGIGKLLPSMLIALKQQGVRPEYVHDILALGFGPYSIHQFIEFKNQGVPIELFAALKEYGLLKADPNEIREAKIHGVGASSLREAKQYSSNLNLKQIIRLKQAGVI
ncbi:MAG: peptidase BlaR1 [Candidatus Solibacter sp.]|jgi:beta-lactamase regulating signal transducer with metallopeptidase domain|nr:peptidase BlaR1 [Candidatus Solibacter sp.]